MRGDIVHRVYGVHGGRDEDVYFGPPGAEGWSPDDEWPNGELGFVWGCLWGDDSSWKVQLLDLTEVQRGVIRREERFGYLELATGRWLSPAMSQLPVEPPRPPFVSINRHDGKTSVRFDVEMSFDLASGQPRAWKRTEI